MQVNALRQARPLVSITGEATFHSPHLSRLSTHFGPDIAWRAASFEQGITAAAANVSGAFSVGLCDGQGRTSLAVDRFGIHTLCYRLVNGTLRFAPRADMLADPQTEIDPQAIFDYLFFHAIPAPRTIYKGIYRLPPAHCAEFENGVLSVAPYWVPALVESPKTPFADLREEFLHLLRQAVGDRLDGSKSACFLGGGQASSALAGVIAAVSGQPAATYSVGFDASGYEETEYARVAAKHLGTAHHEHHLTPADLVRSIGNVASHYDQPFGNPAALSAYYCAAMARADGVSQLLADDGGEQLFGGTPGAARPRVLGWYGALPGMLHSQPMEPGPAGAPAQRRPRLASRARFKDQARAALPQRLGLYNLLNRLGMEQVFTPDFLQRVDPMAAPTRQWRSWQSACNCLIQQDPAFDWRNALAETALPGICGTSSLAQVDVAFPMLDQRLLDFSLRLPAAYKPTGLKPRSFFKEALRGFLPDAVLHHRKHSSSLPFGVWTCQHPALYKLASDSLQSLGERGIVRRGFITTLLLQHLPQHPGYYGEMVWLLVVLEQWLRVHAPLYRSDR